MEDDMVEVTDEMIEAGWSAWGSSYGEADHRVMHQLYIAMHALRPVPAVEITEAMVAAAYRSWCEQPRYPISRDAVRAILTAALGAGTKTVVPAVIDRLDATLPALTEMTALGAKMDVGAPHGLTP